MDRRYHGCEMEPPRIAGDGVPLPATITAWQCIGCGRLEAPQNCIGVCQDRKVELVSAYDYAEARGALDDATERIAALESLVAKLAHVTPRDDAWQRTYLGLQHEARALMRGAS
jgi:hypothetical protein